MEQRAADARQIEEAYESVERALSRVGKLLRTTDAGRFMWSREHKTAVAGLKIIVNRLRRDVPNYGQHDTGTSGAE